MDLRIFDFDSEKGHPMKYRLNGATGFLKCRWLEWSGWYNLDVYQRLLGHYRLFQHFKKDKYLKYRRIPVYQAYILNYRATHEIKYFLSKVVSFIFSTFTRKPYVAVEMEGLNRILVNEGATVLQQFLADAEADFEQALVTAAVQIQSPEFICRTAKGFSAAYYSYKEVNEYVQVNDYNETHIYNEFNAYNELHEHTEVNNVYTTVAKGAQGKEKGVFSKKQILILSDLIAEEAGLGKIDFSKPNQFDALAGLLQAITGKGAASFKEELMNYRTKGLYDTHTPGELNQLIGTLINLAEPFRNGYYRPVAMLVDKKILELEIRKKREYPD
ncbi:MAG TPA: hypothetical protein VF939_02745 [Puia sp.]